MWQYVGKGDTDSLQYVLFLMSLLACKGLFFVGWLTLPELYRIIHSVLYISLQSMR